MTEHDLNDDSDEPGAIGVGMGGSCPTCRAPVDLGQEFCLECGSPIRFTPRQRQKRRTAAAAAGGTSAPAKERRGSGFPWVPFLVVLALVGGGIVLALVDGGESGSSKSKDSATTEEALPTITNESEPPTTSSGVTTTLQDCDPAQPLNGTEPAVPDEGLSTEDEQIPSLGDSGSNGVDDGTLSPFDTPTSSDVPSIEPSDGSSTPAVTVDQNGDLCPNDGGTSTGTTPTTSTTTGTTGTTPQTTSTTSGSWPIGKAGWTVFVAGYTDEARAQQRAADVQEDGYSDSGVLFSSDFQSLCPGWYVVYSGVFDTRSQANARLREMEAKPAYAAMYVREVDANGTKPSSCPSAN